MIRHYSSIISICHPFQPSPIPLLRVVLFRSILFLMLQNYNKIVLMPRRLTAFRSQCQWTRISISLTTPIAMGLFVKIKLAYLSLLYFMTSLLSIEVLKKPSLYFRKFAI